MTESTARPAPPRILWPIVTFLVVTCLATVVLVLVGHSWLGLDGSLLFVGQFGPTVGALVTFARFRRFARESSPASIGTIAHRRRWTVAVVAMAGYAVLMVAVAHASGLARDGLPFAGWTFAAYLALQFVGAFGEEFGWRGLLQPALETRMPPLAAMATTGVLWAAWHVQYFAEPLFWLLFAASCVALSIIMGTIATGSRLQRALVATFVHWVANVSILTAIDAGFSLEVWPALAPSFVVAAIALAVTRWRRRFPAGIRAPRAHGATPRTRAADRAS